MVCATRITIVILELIAAHENRPCQRRHLEAPRASRIRPPARPTIVHAPSWSTDQQTPFRIRPGRIVGPHPLPSRQFQALFDSLFKILFIFPSRYLFAIGLSPVFSLGRSLVLRQGLGRTGLSPSQASLSRELGPGPSLRTPLQTTIRVVRLPDSQAGLLPIRSPLLGESL